MAATLNYEPIEINAYFRSHTHLPLWEILEKAGFWNRVAIKVNFTYCDSSSEAEAGLFSGEIDLISGNHISPYALVARGKKKTGTFQLGGSIATAGGAVCRTWL